MKSVLVISQILPFKSNNGGSTQIRNLLIALKRRNIITDFVSFNLPEADEKSYNEVKTFLKNHTRRYFIIPVRRNFRSRFYKFDQILNYFSDKMNRLIRMLSDSDYNAVFAEFISMGHYLPVFSNIPKIINIHELNFLRQMRENNNKYALMDRIYLLLETIKSASAEIKLLKNSDVICSYSEIETELIKILIPEKDIIKIPLTVEIPSYIKPPRKREFDFVFLGNFEHKPNRDSAEFILEHNKSIIKDKRLLLGGRNIHLLRNKDNLPHNIVLEENIENPQDFLQKARILLFPAFTGGGARVKITEAFANGNLIITTPTGAEGLNPNEKEGVFIFTKEKFLGSGAYEIAENFLQYSHLIDQNFKYAESFHNIDASLKFREFYIK